MEFGIYEAFDLMISGFISLLRSIYLGAELESMWVLM